jgi:hypothetical protein
MRFAESKEGWKIRKQSGSAVAYSQMGPIVHLSGGLGNQLFMYFAGIYLGTLLERTPLFYASQSKHDRSNKVSPLLDLDLGEPIHSEPLGNLRIRYFFRFLAHGLLRALGVSREMKETLSRIHHVTEIGKDENLESVRAGALVFGYFQTFQYYSALLSSGRVSQPKPLEPSSWYQSAVDEIVKTRPIAVHVRRGDYLADENRKLGTLSMEYFQEAITCLKQTQPLLSKREIWFFTDSPDDLEAELSGLDIQGARLVREPKGTSTAEILCLMAKAEAIVVSNSTFSWWAGMLSESSVVVAPEKWYRDADDPRELIPPDWLRVKSRWT